jgi:predicted HicB family RNase H-like nuclease
MKTTMEHRGYTASVEWDEECGCYSGTVLDTWGTVVFSGDTLEDVRDRFKGILDWYLEECERDGVEPRLSNREEMAHCV